MPHRSHKDDIGPLEQVRIEAGMSRKRVAEELGTTEQTVYRWETGKHPVTRANRLALAQLYGVPPERLGLAGVNARGSDVPRGTSTPSVHEDSGELTAEDFRTARRLARAMAALARLVEASGTVPPTGSMAFVAERPTESAEMHPGAVTKKKGAPDRAAGQLRA